MLQRNNRPAWFWHSWKHTGNSRTELRCPKYRSNFDLQNAVYLEKNGSQEKNNKNEVWTHQNFSPDFFFYLKYLLHFTRYTTLYHFVDTQLNVQSFSKMTLEHVFCCWGFSVEFSVFSSTIPPSSRESRKLEMGTTEIITSFDD